MRTGYCAIDGCRGNLRDSVSAAPGMPATLGGLWAVWLRSRLYHGGTMAGKKYRAFAEKLEDRPYSLGEALPLLKDNQDSKFDETVELHISLGVDPRHADQMVRGTIVLPHGLGKTKSVLVVAVGEMAQAARDAGADFVGGEEIVEKIQKENWLEFDALISTPDMMRHVGKLGRVLGPRGLMPNPKTGTVTTDVAAAVNEIKAGRIEFRVDKGGVIHAPVGKLSFDADKLADNSNALISAIVKAKPAAVKGKYVKKITLCSTMSPAIQLDESGSGK
jgi:large subunit ribosomal protein L1